MGLWSAFQRAALFMPLLVHITLAIAQPKVFNVMNYGAAANGNTDNSKAFLKAWNEACEWKGNSRVLIPQGTYKLGSVIFKGPCQGSINFLIQGDLVAQTDEASLFTDHWITFQYIHGLIVSGGGLLDGQGSSAWHHNDCHKTSQCKPLPVSMRFDFVINSTVHHITSINSKNSHFNIYGCKRMKLSNIRILAPGDSPNTDGIHIGSSSGIKMTNLQIATGDDCLSLSPGSKNIHISKVHCGPGHGISVGSLGRSMNGETVKNLLVKNCTFWNTTNGVRIKTWAASLPGIASDLTYEDIVMKDVSNPIIIDQEYCPYPPCNQEFPSKIQISNVIFKNIWGTSSSKVAVNLKCSQGAPCQNIKLQDIDLAYHGDDGPATSWCSHVNGDSVGYQNPPSCL